MLFLDEINWGGFYMNENQVKVHKLCNEISNYKSFVLYGAGYVAEMLLDALEKRNHQPTYCVVTNLKENAKKIRGIFIYDFSEKVLELQKEDILIIVAVTDLYEKEIASILFDNNIVNVVFASNYLWLPLCQKSFEDIYRDKDWEWYVSRIEEWFFERYSTNLPEYSLCPNMKEKKNAVLFVVENFSPRVVKIAKALKKTGKDVLLFLNAKVKQSAGEKFYTSLQNEDIQCCTFDLIEELIFLLLQNKGNVIHIFSNCFNPYTAYILVKLQNFIGKIVFENYDIANGFYTDLNENIIKMERYCIENARGICHREFSLEYLIEVLNFKIKGKTIRFFDYCCDEEQGNEKYEKCNELSICYAGGVVTEDDYPDCPFGGFLEIAERCEKNKCHLHIYPSVWDEKRYEKYIRKDKESLYFHFHKTIPYSKLISELSQYDYGICPTRDDVWEKDSSGYNIKNKYIYAGTNKYFDYLDAGLPIITAIPQKFVQYLEEKGVLINWTNGQYDFEFLLRMKDTMHDNVIKAKENLKISNNINKLLKFYESL